MSPKPFNLKVGISICLLLKLKAAVVEITLNELEVFFFLSEAHTSLSNCLYSEMFYLKGFYFRFLYNFQFLYLYPPIFYLVSLSVPSLFFNGPNFGCILLVKSNEAF